MDMFDRHLKEIQFKETDENKETLAKIEAWAQENCMYPAVNNIREYILLMPHPKHPSLGGQSFDEFTEDCPILLKTLLEKTYEEYKDKMQNEKWTSEYDLANDFGFILIAIL